MQKEHLSKELGKIAIKLDLLIVLSGCKKNS